MATVWMRAKLQKLKPKTEARFAVRDLQNDGPGMFPPVRMPEAHRPLPVVIAKTQYIQPVRALDTNKRTPAIGKGQRARHLRTYGNFDWRPASVVTSDVYAAAGEVTLIRNGRVVTA